MRQSKKLSPLLTTNLRWTWTRRCSKLTLCWQSLMASDWCSVQSRTLKSPRESLTSNQLILVHMSNPIFSDPILSDLTMRNFTMGNHTMRSLALRSPINWRIKKSRLFNLRYGTLSQMDQDPTIAGSQPPNLDRSTPRSLAYRRSSTKTIPTWQASTHLFWI